MKKKNWNLIIGVIISGILILMIVTGFFYTPYDPNAMNGSEKLSGPSLAHLMGTDNFGRDIFSRVLDGGGTTLLVGLVTVLSGAVVGTIAGAFTGYYGGILDEILMRVNDIITAFPSVLLALIFISVLGSGKYNIMPVSYTHLFWRFDYRCQDYVYLYEAVSVCGSDLGNTEGIRIG